MALLKTEPVSSFPAHTGQSVFADVVAAFFRSKRRILAAVVAFIVLLTVFMMLGRKSYESRLIFLVRDEASTFPTDSVGSRSDAQMGPASDTQIGTEIELLSSLDLHRQVILALHPGLSSAEVDRQLLGFDKTLQILPIPKTSLIGVTYNAGSAQAANETLATLSRLYLDYRSKVRGSDSAYTFFDQQANKYYAMLQVDQQNLADFNQKNQVTLIGEEKDVTVHRLADARALLYDNEASAGEAQRRMQTMTSARQTLPARVVTQRRDLPDQQEAGRLNSVLVDLQNERVTLLTKYHPTDRHVQEVDAKIANITAALKQSQQTKATEEATDLNPLRQTVDSDLQQDSFRVAGLQARERSLAGQVNAYSAKLDELNRVTAESDDLTRKLKEDEASYELYASKREGARINKTLDSDKIANVQPVSGPSIVPHSRGQVVVSALVLYTVGTVLIAGMGILAGLWSPRFYAPRELEAALGTPVLATIPRLEDVGDRKGRTDLLPANSGSWPNGPGAGSSLVLDGMTEGRAEWPHSEVDRYTAGIYNDGSRRSGIYLPLIERMRRCEPPRPGLGSVFAFTSCNSGEGVSHFVRGLGAELSDYTGKRVAIVNALDSYETSVDYTDLAPTGTRSQLPRSGEEFLQEWFQRLRAAHDYVLIDCPALSTSHAAAVFGPSSDGLLLVVEAGKATRSQLRGGLAMLSLGSVSIMGLALNKRSYPIPDAIYSLL